MFNWLIKDRMEFKFNYHGRNLKLDVEVCDKMLSQGRGLMFRKESKSLLFVFGSKNRRAIHSFFCKPFYAIWFDDNEIVDERLVENWKFIVRPKKGFNKLLEIPTESEALKIVVEGEKHLNTK